MATAPPDPSTHLFPAAILPTQAHPQPAAPSASASSAGTPFALPPGYTIRPLARGDHASGMLDVLRVLTTVGDIAADRWLARFDHMRAGFGKDGTDVGTYYVLVVCDDKGIVVGTGTVVVERKFIHDLGLVGHIEDIAVAKNQQGKKLGLRIIQALDHVAEKVGCYKAILDCSEANEGFYVKCGYKRAGLEMAHYY